MAVKKYSAKARALGARKSTLRRVPTMVPRRSYVAKRYRMPTNVTGGIYKFVEKCSLGYNAASSIGPKINVGALTQAGGVMTFKITDLLNSSSYINLFDLFKIDKVELQIIPQANVAQTNLAGASGAGVLASSIPQLYIAPNKDYFVPAPVSGPDVLNDDGVMVLMMDRPRTVSIWQPRAQIADAKTGPLPPNRGVFADNVQEWLSTGGNEQTVDQTPSQYFGFRWWVDNTQNGGGFTPTIIATYHVSFKERD